MRNRRRQLRFGAFYQVTCKINRDEIIFDNNIIATLLLDIIARCKKKYTFSIKKFYFMGNCVHFIIFPEGNASLPKIMQWINSVFAKTYNKKMGISGRLWKERYSSKIIESIDEFINTFEYIEKKPLMSKLMNRARDYRYSGLYHYLHKIEGLIEHRGQLISTLYEYFKSF
jgi:REP element-mobilizing transposase RayT